MKNTDRVILERRKIVGTDVIEIYKYKSEETKDAFFKHYKEMQIRGFKNDRSKDHTENGYLYVTYAKNVLAKKGRA